MANQVEVNWVRRQQTFLLMVGVIEHFDLRAETLFSAVSIMDRFLCLRIVPSSMMDAIGVLSVFIAAKCEEVNCNIDLKQLVDILNDRSIFDRAKLSQVEIYILETIDYDVLPPTAETFIQLIFSEATGGPDSSLFTVARFLAELGLWRGRIFVSQKPLRVAQAAILAASWMLGHEENVVRDEAGLPKSVDVMAQKLWEDAIHAPSQLKARHGVTPFVQIPEEESLSTDEKELFSSVD